MKNNYLPTLVGSQSHSERSVVETFSAPPESQPPGFSLNDGLFILFRHKWKILICTAAGILAAAGIYLFMPPLYESQAKLLVRYVVERSTVDSLDAQAKNLGSPTENAINSEVEILTSSDLAMQVATSVGINRLLPGSGEKATDANAALVILKNLEVAGIKESNIISVSYKNKDPKLANEVLQELVKRYFDKHLEVHRSLGGFEFITREAEQLRAELSRTEEGLKELKSKAGITSLSEDTASLATELAKTQEELATSDGELAAQQARVGELEKLMAGVDSKQPEGTVPQPSSEVVGEYQALIARAAKLRETQTELLSRYTAQNRIVKVKQGQIDVVEKQRKDLEKRYPGLLGTVAVAGEPPASRPDIISEKARLMSLQATANSQKARYAILQERAKIFSELGPEIAQLERKKEVEETNYKYYGASLEKARIDATLDPSRMPNISVVQAPSPPDRAKRDLKKVLMGLVGGGVAVGLAFALLIELVLDRTIKRSSELETHLRIPLLLSIPNFGSESSRLRLYNSGDDSDTLAKSTDSESEAGELLKPYCEAIRDRLGLYFEVNRMTHKPKLVAVTGMSKNAGASTLAAGLASTLSETDDGHRVLLIDKPVAPKRFYDMLTEFKASDLDYVIFDMPSLGDTSSTVSLAGFMDKILLVVEAEKSSREAIKRSYAQLASKADVSVVFNKSRSYGVKWLDGEV